MVVLQFVGSAMGRDGQVRNETSSLNEKISLGQGEDAKVVSVEICLWREVRFSRADRARGGLHSALSTSNG